MLLAELMLVEDEEKVQGSYVAAKFSEESQDRLYEFAKSLVKDNIVPKEKFHVTIIYSRKPIPAGFKVKNLSEKNPLVVSPKSLTIFPTQTGSKALVLELDAPELVKRHKSLMDKYDLTFDFDEYKPHTTISYDCGDFKIPEEEKNLISSIGDLDLVKEYHEPLQLDWAEKNT